MPKPGLNFLINSHVSCRCRNASFLPVAVGKDTKKSEREATTGDFPARTSTLAFVGVQRNFYRCDENHLCGRF